MASVFLTLVSLLAVAFPCLGLVSVPLQREDMPIAKELLKKTDALVYYGRIFMGTPPQEMFVAFDTGSSVFGMLNVSCSDPECRNHHLYNHNKSSTYKPLYGGRSSDVVQVAGLTVNGQMFVEENKDLEFLVPLDGVVGLGFPMPGQHLLIANMVEQKLIDKPMFSFFIARDEGSYGEGSYGGELAFGGTDPSRHTGTITYLPVTSDEYWQVHMNSICSTEPSCVNVCPSGCEAIVDTGTSLIVGPTAMVNLLNQQLKATRQTNGMYFFDCDKVSSLPPVMISLNGQHFPLTHKDYVLEEEKSGIKECLSGFLAMDLPMHNNTWVLGNMFLRTYYSVFNLETKSVGFAPAVM